MKMYLGTLIFLAPFVHDNFYDNFDDNFPDNLYSQFIETVVKK